MARSCQGQVKVSSRSDYVQDKPMVRSDQSHINVKAKLSSCQDQVKVRSRSSEGQFEVSTRSGQGYVKVM